MSPDRPTSTPTRERDRLRDVNAFAAVPRHWLETSFARRLQRPLARFVLLALSVIAAGLYSAALFVDDPGGTFVGALVLFLVVASLAMLAAGPTVFAPLNRLDERESVLRGRVMSLSYPITSIVLLAIFVVVAVGGSTLAYALLDGGGFEAATISRLMSTPILFGLLLHTLVPLGVIAWIERDHRPDPAPLDDDPVDAAAPFDHAAEEAQDVAHGPRRVRADHPDARRATAAAAPGAVVAAAGPGPATTSAPGAPDPTAAVAPDRAGRPVTHDFPVVDDAPPREPSG